MESFFLICAILSFLSGVVGSSEVEKHIPGKGLVLFAVSIFIWVNYSAKLLLVGPVFLGVAVLLLVFVLSMFFMLAFSRTSEKNTRGGAR